MNRRVEIILERYKDDYPSAMGELNIRRIALEKRVHMFREERRAVNEEIQDINALLSQYQKSKPQDK